MASINTEYIYNVAKNVVDKERFSRFMHNGSLLLKEAAVAGASVILASTPATMAETDETTSETGSFTDVLSAFFSDSGFVGMEMIFVFLILIFELLGLGGTENEDGTTSNTSFIDMILGIFSLLMPAE